MVETGLEIIEKSDDLEVNEQGWGFGIIKKNVFLKDNLQLPQAKIYQEYPDFVKEVKNE